MLISTGNKNDLRVIIFFFRVQIATNHGRKRCSVPWKVYCMSYKMMPRFHLMSYNPLVLYQHFYGAFIRWERWLCCSIYMWAWLVLINSAMFLKTFSDHSLVNQHPLTMKMPVIVLQSALLKGLRCSNQRLARRRSNWIKKSMWASCIRIKVLLNVVAKYLYE